MFLRKIKFKLLWNRAEYNFYKKWAAKLNLWEILCSLTKIKWVNWNPNKWLHLHESISPKCKLSELSHFAEVSRDVGSILTTVECTHPLAIDIKNEIERFGSNIASTENGSSSLSEILTEIENIRTQMEKHYIETSRVQKDQTQIQTSILHHIRENVAFCHRNSISVSFSGL